MLLRARDLGLELHYEAQELNVMYETRFLSVGTHLCHCDTIHVRVNECYFLESILGGFPPIGPEAGSPGVTSSTSSTKAPSGGSGITIKRSPSILKVTTPPRNNEAPENVTGEKKLQRARRVPTMTMEEEAQQDAEKQKRDERNEREGVSTVRRGVGPKAKAGRKKSGAKAWRRNHKARGTKKCVKAKSKACATKPGKKSTGDVLREGASRGRAAKVATAAAEAIADQAKPPTTPKCRITSKSPDQALAKKTPKTDNPAPSSASKPSMSRSLSDGVLQALTRASTADKLADKDLPELAADDEALDAGTAKKLRHNKRNSFYRSLNSTLTPKVVDVWPCHAC